MPLGRLKLNTLGNVIDRRGVSADPSKIRCMVGWPCPSTAKALRGFLGLTGYHRKFVKNYAIITKPLTSLLNKGQFNWTPEATEAFPTLKKAMINTSVLRLPYYNRAFVLETDACYGSIGTVLMQEGHPLAFLSKALGPRSLGLSVNEKELLAIIIPVTKWRSYLLTWEIIIRTELRSLRYLLDQKISTALHQKYLTKLLGYTYRIE